MNAGSSTVFARVLLRLIALYQATAMMRAPRCRFSPTCSRYASDAVTMHGALRGGWLAGRRVLRCHPFHPGGHDPVPGSQPATDHGDHTSSDAIAA